MTQSVDHDRRLHEALRLHALGLRLIPLRGKRPRVRHWPELPLGREELGVWAARGANFGILTGAALVVIDTDTAAAEAWLGDRGITSTVVVRSGGGGWHRYFAAPSGLEIHSTQALHGVPGLDIKGWRSFIVAAASVHPETGRRYEYLPGQELADLAELPVFEPAWVQRQRRMIAAPAPAPANANGHAHHPRIRDVRAYIRTIASVQGQGGDKACFTVACLLASAGYAFDAALAELESWNAECAVPAWSREELARKLRYAYQRVRVNP